MAEEMKEELQETNQIPEEPDDTEPRIFKPKKRKRRVIIPIVVVIIVAAAAYGGYHLLRKQPSQTGESYSDYTVAARDITLSLSGTGTLEPADSYTVTGLVAGEILSAPFEEGDIVQKDATLYQIDPSDAQDSIDQAESSLAQSQRAYDQKVTQLDDLTVTSNAAGLVEELLVSAGDKVTTGQTIAKIRDSSTMDLVIPFCSDDAVNFRVGQSAVVTIDGTFEQVAGTISKIGVVDEPLDGNMLVREVTIEVHNPGGISQDSMATAMVGDIACNSGGTFTYKSDTVVTSNAAGDVASINVKEGGWVEKGQKILTLASSTMQNDIENSLASVHDSELSLDSKKKQLDNYTIKSPIAGTIIEKLYKEGDKMSTGQALCTIFDLSYLTMTLKVDELDISQVSVGQAVTITAEALSGKEFEGYVTKVNINGTTSNGVTSYPVTIRLDNTEGLLPGMNVQANIVVSQASGALAVPVSALMRGNFVLVKTDSISADASAAAGNEPQGAQAGQDQQSGQGQGQQGQGQYTQRGQGQRQQGQGQQGQGQFQQGQGQSQQDQSQTQTPQQDQSQAQTPQQGGNQTQTPQQDQSQTQAPQQGASQTQTPQQDQSQSQTPQQGQGQYQQGQGQGQRPQQGQGFSGGGNASAASGSGSESSNTPASGAAVPSDNAATPSNNAGTPSGNAAAPSDNAGTSPDAGSNAQHVFTSNIPDGYTLVRVSTGISDGSYIEITSGLTVGEIVAVPQSTVPQSTSNVGFLPGVGVRQAGGNQQFAGGPPAAPAGGGQVTTYSRGATAGS